MSEMKHFHEGDNIGNYRIIRTLGQGGMGTVYEVEHLELGTHYALKTFTFEKGHEASHALEKKFLEEGKLLARLKHPNLTHVFDLGFEGEMPYFVMDLVTYSDGGTYTVEDIDLSDIDEEMVYGWFVELASVLDYVHGEGIVHRDIKPSNLLIDKDLHVILTDFGISRIFGAKIKSAVDATRTVVTKTGRGKLILGTENYIAPEVDGGAEATPQADAYSLGVMLLRWLTGFYYGDNPGALALLSRKKYCWHPVITKLLAKVGNRPEKYSELIPMLKPAPAAVPAAAPVKKPTAKKKRSKVKENILAAVLGLSLVGILFAGGYFAWQYFDRRMKEQKAQFVAWQKSQEAKDAAEKAEKEREDQARKERDSEEKRIAEEKRKAREAKLAEERRIEASRIKIEKQNANELTVAKVPDVQEREEAKEEKREFKVIEKLSEEKTEKDYGPIPDKKYNWLKGGNVKNPLKVDFELANGAKMELMPIKAGVFYMLNQEKQGQSHHKVVLTYPFWMSKFRVTANQWREFAPNDCEDCRAIEAAVGPDYPVSKRFSRKSVLAYCQYLTEKYSAQLPKDYVFRLPSEAEWERAMDIEATRQKYLKFVVPGKRYWSDSISQSGIDAKAK